MAAATALHLCPTWQSLPNHNRFINKSRPSIRPSITCYASYSTNKWKREYTSVMIVPTGVGASIGGFAGDALPVARALSSVVDCLISHPNVLNAAMLYWPMPNVLYIEGYALDRFAEGLWALRPVHQNKVGLVLDAGIEEHLRIRHLQVADATRASLGLPVVEYIVTDTPLEVEKWVNPTTGQSTGRIKHPDSLLRAVKNLVKRSQVDAVAVVGRFPDDEVDDLDGYRLGTVRQLFLLLDFLSKVQRIYNFYHLEGNRYIGGSGGSNKSSCGEGISDTLAHAPALSPLPLTSSLSPKSAAEEIGYSYLPCVLAGLSNAPQYVVKNSESSEKGCILASDVDSIILPIDSCGGDGALAFARSQRNKPLIICVEENETVLNDTADKLGIKVVKVSNYWEAIGVIAAHKAGIDPNSLRRNRIDNICYPSIVSANGFAVSRATSIT
ncbi:hypothetical protein REPUB_Repub04eG0207600 [Reevesia pubescens]